MTVDSPGSPIRVAIVDDDPLVRAALVMVLGGASDIELVGEGANGQQAIDLVGSASPDIVLMDIRMPVMDGLEATIAISRLASAPHIIVLTTFDADEYVARALAGGAQGFLLKDTPPADLVSAVRTVAAGDPILSPAVTASLIRQLTAPAANRESRGRERAMALVDTLTEREREVALAVASGESNAQVAVQLYMSVATVKAHVSRVLTKLDATNRVQIAITMHDAGLL